MLQAPPDLNLNLLKTLVELPGIPGREHRIRQEVTRRLEGLADELSTDNMGNLVARKKGTNNPDNRRILLAAHMDEIGFLVKHIEKGGFLRVHPLGGFDPQTLIAQRMWVHTAGGDLPGVFASKPIHLSRGDNKSDKLKLDDLVVDTGLPEETVKARVQPGDWLSRQGDLLELGDCLTAKSLDNRLAVFLLLEALRLLESCPWDVYAVFTVQEEVGLRGAQVAAQHIKPTVALALDGTVAYDLPDAKSYEAVSRLGQGVAIKVADGSVVSDTRLVAFLNQICQQHNIPHQTEILPAGGTDAGALQRFGQQGGAITGCLSVPMRYLHTSVETVHRQDVAHALQLLTNSLEQIGELKVDW